MTIINLKWPKRTETLILIYSVRSVTVFNCNFSMQNITRAATISFLSLNLTPCTMISILVLFFDNLWSFLWLVISFCIGHVCGLLITVLKSDGLVSILIVNKTVREYLLVHLSPFNQSFYTQAVRHHTPCYNLVD